jgi:hypothetical protein
MDHPCNHHAPCGLPAARSYLRRWRSSGMACDIASSRCLWIWRRGARHPPRPGSSATCYKPSTLRARPRLPRVRAWRQILRRSPQARARPQTRDASTAIFAVNPAQVHDGRMRDGRTALRSPSARVFPTARRTAGRAAHCRPRGALPDARRTADRAAHCRPRGALPTARRTADRAAHCRPRGALPDRQRPSPPHAHFRPFPHILSPVPGMQAEVTSSTLQSLSNTARKAGRPCRWSTWSGAELPAKPRMRSRPAATRESCCMPPGPQARTGVRCSPSRAMR